MDDPVLLRAKFLLSAFADDDEKPSNRNEVKEVIQELLCGAIKGSSLISTYSDARSIAKRGQFIYIDSNKCQVAEDAEWTSSKIQLAYDYDGDTNFNAVITLAPNPNQIKKIKKEKKKKVKPASSPSSPSTISIQQSIASSDQPYSEILEKANSLLSDIKSASVNIENSPTIPTKPSKLQIKNHVSNPLNNSSNSNTIYENDEDNNDEDDDGNCNDSHNVSVKSIHNKNSKKCLNPVNKHTSSSSPNNIHNNSFLNKANTASHIPQSNEYHDENSSSYDTLYQNSSQTYTTGASYTSLKADAEKVTADMKRQVILNRLAQKMKEDKQKLIEKEIEEEKIKSELKWKSDQKAKQFQEITNERVAKRLKEEALRREELEKQKQLEEELKLKKAQEAIEVNQTKLKELKKETAKRLRQRELEKKKEMEDEIKNIALKIEEVAIQTGRSKVLLRPDNSSTPSFRNHNNNNDNKHAASHTKSTERQIKHQTIDRHRHNTSHIKTNSSKEDYENSHDNDNDKEDNNDLLSQDSLHQKHQKNEFYEENNEENDYVDDEDEEDEVELNEHYLQLMQSSNNNNNNIKQFSNSNLNNDLMNKAKSVNNNKINSSKISVKNSSNKIDTENYSKSNEIPSISKIPRAQINKSSYMNIDNDIHNSCSQNKINQSRTLTPLQRAHTSNSVIIDNNTETNDINNIRQSSSASKFVDRTRQTITNAKKLIPIPNKNSSKNPTTTTIKPTKSKETKGKATNSASKDIHHKDEIGIITKVRKMSDHSVFSEITTMEDEDNDNEGLDEDDDKEDEEFLLINNGLEKEKNIQNNQALGYEDYAVTAIDVTCKPKKKKQFQPWRKLKPISIPAYRPLPPPPSLTVHE